METKKLRNVLVGDYEVPGAKDNLWIDTSNPNVAVEKIYDRDKWVEVGNTSDIIAKNEEQDSRLDTAESNITDLQNNKQDTPETAGSNGQILSIQSGEPTWVNPTAGSTVDSSMMDDSENPVQNKVIKAYVDTGAGKANADELTITPGTGLDADKTTIQLKTGTSATVLTGHQSLSDYAKSDGYYETLGAGTADNLRGQSVTSEPVLFRMTGGTDTELANGVASMEGIEGHSVVWNQLIKRTNNSSTSNNVTFTAIDGGFAISTTNDGASANTQRSLTTSDRIAIVKDHKYYFHVCSNSNIRLIETLTSAGMSDIYGSMIKSASKDAEQIYALRVNSGTIITEAIDVTPIMLDLTLIFGAGNEPATVEAFESWLSKNVGLKAYYPYNAGTILNAKPERLISTGRNLLNPTTGEAYLKTYEWEDNDNTYEIIGTYTGLSFTDMSGNTTTPVPDANSEFVIDNDGVLTVTATDLSQVCVQAVWDETYDGEFVEFEQNQIDIDVTKIYGQLNGEGDYVQVYPNGMLSAGSVKDVLTKDSAIINVKQVNAGTLEWELVSNRVHTFRTAITDKRLAPTGDGDSLLLCSDYVTTVRKSTPAADTEDKIICELKSLTDWTKYIIISDSAYSAAPTALNNWIDGVIVNYVLETPLVYTNLVYRDNGVDIPWSLPMQYIVDNWGTERVESVETEGASDPQTCASILDIIYAMDAVEEIDTLKTNGVMVADLKSNIDALLVALNSALTDIGTITVSETATDKVFSFTFTPAESEPES